MQLRIILIKSILMYLKSAVVRGKMQVCKLNNLGGAFPEVIIIHSMDKCTGSQW